MQEVKRKFYMNATAYVQFKGEVIEASDEKVARAEFRSALEGGIVNKDSVEFEIDCIEVTGEGEDDE